MRVYLIRCPGTILTWRCEPKNEPVVSSNCTGHCDVSEFSAVRAEYAHPLLRVTSLFLVIMI